jgi:hypothetical protein
VTLTAMVDSQRSNGNSDNVAVLATPALFTSASHRPRSSASQSNNAVIDSAAETSTCLPNAGLPAVEMSAATASASSPSRSAMTIMNPADSRRAIASPMPAAPPVITATP